MITQQHVEVMNRCLEAAIASYEHADLDAEPPPDDPDADAFRLSMAESRHRLVVLKGLIGRDPGTFTRDEAAEAYKWFALFAEDRCGDEEREIMAFLRERSEAAETSPG